MISGLPLGWTDSKPNSVSRCDFNRLFPHHSVQEGIFMKIAGPVSSFLGCLQESKPKIMSLFTGVGGLELGLSKSGTKIDVD